MWNIETYSRVTGEQVAAHFNVNSAWVRGYNLPTMSQHFYVVMTRAAVEGAAS